MIPSSSIATVVVLAVGLPGLFLLSLGPVSQVWAALRTRRETAAGDSAAPAQLLFIVPAHDEEAVIGDCIRSLLAMDHPDEAMEVVVVADNCRDRTAEVARSAGATCLQRQDPAKPGKPHALAWALQRLPYDRWDALVIIDADTIVDAGFARALSRRGPLAEKCVQSYVDLPNVEQSWLTRLSSLLARVRNEHQYPLKEAVGLNCPPATGMSIGSQILVRDGGWSAFSLTENWELYARYTLEGIRIEYEQGARIYARESSGLANAATQRKRWLAGRTWVLGQFWRRILESERIGRHQKLDAIAELASPSPVLHLSGATILAGAMWIVLRDGFGATVAALALATLTPMGVQTLLALRRDPQRWRTAGSLLCLPLYALWRIMTAVRTVGTLRRGAWVKTERNVT